MEHTLQFVGEHVYLFTFGTFAVVIVAFLMKTFIRWELEHMAENRYQGDDE